MAIPFLQPINLSQNELQNARIQNLASDPGSPVVGQVWFNTTSNTYKYYDGTVRTLVGLQNKITDLAVPTSSPSMGSQTVQNVATPVNPTDAANKAYVDNSALGLDVKASVKCATTGAGTLASSFANGQSIDSITLITGDRILVKNQAAPADNGIYTVAASGAPTRSTDCNSSTTYVTGAFVFIEEGTVNAGASYVVQTQGSITPGTTPVTWVQFSGGASTSANNLAGGSAGALVYQSGGSTTNFLSGNTAATDQVLVSHGTGAAANAPTLSGAPALSAANMTSFPTVPNATSAVNFTGSLAGDVTGTQGATSVSKVNGLAVPTSAGIVGTNSSNQLINVSTLPTAAMPALSGDVTGVSGTLGTTVTKINGTSLAALATGLLKNTTTTGVPVIASAGTDYVAPSGSITGSAGSFTGALVGDVSGNQGTTSVDKIKGVALPTIAAATGILYDTAGTLSLAATLPTAAIPALTGDVTGTAGSTAVTVTKLNNTSLSGLATGILKNTTGTGVPTIAAAGTDYVAPTGNVANITSGVLGSVPYQSAPSTTGMVAGNTVANDAVLTSTGTGTVSAAPTFKNAPALSAANMTAFPTLNQSTSGSAASFTGSLVGDVTGTQGATSVGKIGGVTLPTLTASTGILYDTAGTLSLQTTLPTAAEPAHTGDVTNTAGNLGMTVKGLNGTLLSGLASGLLYNTTGTGVPSAATAAQVVGVIGATAVTNATNATSAATATSLAGVTTDSIPYQSASGTTSYVAPNTTGTSDAVLTSSSVGGSASAPTLKNAPALSAANMTSFPTLNQSTSGTAAGLSATLAVGSGGTNATTAAGARSSLGATGKYAATFGDGTTTSYVITHSLGTTDVIVGVSYVGTPFQVVQCEVQLTSTNTITLVFASAPASNTLRVVVIG